MQWLSRCSILWYNRKPIDILSGLYFQWQGHSTPGHLFALSLGRKTGERISEETWRFASYWRDEEIQGECDGRGPGLGCVVFDLYVPSSWPAVQPILSNSHLPKQISGDIGRPIIQVNPNQGPRPPDSPCRDWRYRDQRGPHASQGI